MLFGTLTVIALGLTIAMFATRQMMLGFPCLIFWAILSGYSYQQSTATWDIYYFLFFGSIFMGIFCALAAFGLRTKKDELKEGDAFIDEGKDDIKFIDDGVSGTDKDTVDENSDKPRRRTRDIRGRAKQRRERFE